MERGSGSEGRRRGGGQHMKCADRQMEELTEDKQTPCSHLVRHLRQAQFPKTSPMAAPARPVSTSLSTPSASNASCPVSALLLMPPSARFLMRQQQRPKQLPEGLPRT